MHSVLTTADSVKERCTAVRALNNGVSVVFRPIESSDVSRLNDFVKSLSLESLHFRFLEIMKELPPETLRRMCSIDYNQEIAIVVQPQSEDKIVAVARLNLDRSWRRGEFALVVADAWQGLRLGTELMSFVFEIARDLGLYEINFFVSWDNYKMIALSKKMGLKIKSADGDTLEMTSQLFSEMT
jgi:acetyltransferase